MAPLGTWAASYHEKADIASQGALAAVSYVASKGIKRLREEASKGAAAATTLAETMKQNEELQAQNAKLQKDYQEAMTLCDERQKGLETLQAELIKGGLMNEKFKFSKLTSREQVPEEPHAAACGRGDALPRGRQGRGLQGGTGGAARRATRSSRRTCSSRSSTAAAAACATPVGDAATPSWVRATARPTSAPSSVARPCHPPITTKNQSIARVVAPTPPPLRVAPPAAHEPQHLPPVTRKSYPRVCVFLRARGGFPFEVAVLASCTVR